MKLYWQNIRKEIIVDSNLGVSCVVGIEKINDEKYGMFNQNKQKIGFIRFWKDFKNIKRRLIKFQGAWFKIFYFFLWP